MERRTFVKQAGLGMLALATPGVLRECGKRRLSPQEDLEVARASYAQFRGFNLLAKFNPRRRDRKFEELDFEIMADWGFNFARIPMSYHCWSSPEDWYRIDEQIIEDIDEVVALGQQYGIHINLNLHRIPGYCINRRELEPYDLFDDTPDNMAQALDAACHHWGYLAARYAGIPSTQLSFDLINEPPNMTTETRYEVIIRRLVATIQAKDPFRLIVADGKDIGRNPVASVADLRLPQSTRGYDPMAISHYEASWPPRDAFETMNRPTWPLQDDAGKRWDRAALRAHLIQPWEDMVRQGIQVHVGEWGCYNRTPHAVALAWMEDLLALWKEAGWGHALWNLRGDFGVLDSGRRDVAYESYKGLQLDRKMLDLLQQYR